MIIIYKRSAEKDLASLDKNTQKKIINKLNKYLEYPSNVDIKILKGHKDVMRIREGDYRIICRLNKNFEIEILEILRIQHRREVYRDL